MTVLQYLAEALEPAREWLAVQPNFGEGWETGCRWVAQMLDSWLERYGKEMELGELDASLRRRYSLRLWDTWGYHWRVAASESAGGVADGGRVAERLELGIRPTTSVTMGGNPLRDVVLAEAALDRSEAAVRLLYHEYHGVFSHEARKAIRQVPDEDQWQDLVTMLVIGSAADVRAGYSGRLAGYKGYSSLKSWLRPVARHHVLDSLRRRQTRMLAEQRFAVERGLPIEEARDEVPELLEAFDLLAKGAGRALASIAVRERWVLVLHFKEGWSNNAIARAIAKSPGQASRIREQAARHFIDKLRDSLGGSVASPHLLDWIVEKDTALLSQLLIGGLAPSAHPGQLSLEDLHAGKERLAMLKALERPRSTHPVPPPVPPAGATPTPKEQVQEQPGQEQAVSIPDSMRHLIPDAIMVADQGEAPPSVFRRLRAERPAVVCVDARADSFGPLDVVRWQEELDQLLEELREDSQSSPYSPRRVVFHRFDESRIRSELSSERSPSDVEFWLSHPDVDWVQTADPRSDLQSLYQRMLVQDLGELLAPNGAETSYDRPSADSRDMMDFIPESERERWRARMEELRDEESYS